MLGLSRMIERLSNNIYFEVFFYEHGKNKSITFSMG